MKKSNKYFIFTLTVIVLLLGITVLFCSYRVKELKDSVQFYEYYGEKEHISVKGIAVFTDQTYYIKLLQIDNVKIDFPVKALQVGYYYRGELRGSQGSLEKSENSFSFNQRLKEITLTFRESISAEQDVFRGKMVQEFPQNTVIRIEYITEDDETVVFDIPLEVVKL